MSVCGLPIGGKIEWLIRSEIFGKINDFRQFDKYFFRHYILHKPVVHVCSEQFLINLRHKLNLFCISLSQWAASWVSGNQGISRLTSYYRYVSGDFRLSI